MCCLCFRVATAHITAGLDLKFQADGRDDWIIVWKKEVNGQKLWDQICPTLSVGDPSDEVEGRFADPSNVLGTRNGPLPPIQCTAHFQHLINGLAGMYNGQHRHPIMAWLIAELAADVLLQPQQCMSMT